MSKPLIALDEDEYANGTVHVSEDYTCMNSLQQADLIEDWICKLQHMQQKITGPGFLEDLAPARFKRMN